MSNRQADIPVIETRGLGKVYSPGTEAEVVALKQVEALAEVAKGEGKQTILMPAQALQAFSDAFAMFRGKP